MKIQAYSSIMHKEKYFIAKNCLGVSIEQDLQMLTNKGQDFTSA